MKARRYILNEKFFSCIDNAEKAYWLGFLFADGYVYKKSKGQGLVNIRLSIEDKEHLEKFCKAVGTNKPIKTYINSTGYSKGTAFVYLQLVSDIMYQDLINLGCVPKKSLSLEFPTKLETSYIPHFIRGYFDGDGSIFQHYQKRNRKTIQIWKYPAISINGTKEFLIKLNSYLPVTSDKVIYKEARKTTNCYYLTLRSKIRVQAFFNYLYNYKTVVCLQRKYDKFISLL